MTLASSANAGNLSFKATLSRAQTVPLESGGLIGDAEVKISFNEAFSAAEFEFKANGGANAVAAHFHCGGPGENGPPAISIFDGFDGEKASGTLTNADILNFGCEITNLVSLAFAMRDGLVYANVHTIDNPPGEVRGQVLED